MPIAKEPGWQAELLLLCFWQKFCGHKSGEEWAPLLTAQRENFDLIRVVPRSGPSKGDNNQML